jgi:WD40 repeat protein
LEDLPKILATLFDDLGKTQRILRATGLELAHIDLTGAPAVYWDRVLDEAWKEKQVIKLVQVAAKSYPEREPELVGGMRRYLEVRAKCPGVRAEPEAAPFVVPFLRNPHFTGREVELERLHTRLSGVGPPGVPPTGLTGMGGIGKTQLAVEYAYRFQGAYPGGVFWVNAAEPLSRGLAGLGCWLLPGVAERSLEEQVRVASNYLRDHTDALVVLDNLADPLELTRPVTADLTPASLPCRVLFTTRRQDVGDFFVPLEVKLLPEGPALQLLLRHPRREAVLDPAHPERPEAQAICAVLGYLPLALEVAGAHLGRRPEARLAAYHKELLRRGALPVLDDPRIPLRPEHLGTRHDAGVAATLAGQWDALPGEDARLLLRVAGQLPEAAQIPTARLGLLVGLYTPDEREGDFFGPPLLLALRELEEASLVMELREGHVRLHPLVREFAAGKTAEVEAASFRRSCAGNVATAYEDCATLEEHAHERGVDAVQEDLLTALVFSHGANDQTHARVRSLLQVLRREAHHLRGWNRQRQPALLAQQLHNRATALALPHLSKTAADRLAQLGRPSLDLLWCSLRDSAELELTLSGHRGGVSAVAVTPDGGRAVSASDDGTVRVWDLATGRVLCALTGHAGPVTAVAVTPDGRRAVSASDDRTLRVWDLAAGHLLHALTGHAGPVTAVAVTPDGRRAVSASDDGTVRVWDLAAGLALYRPFGHGDLMTAVAVTTDGNRAVSGSDDGTLCVWNLATGEALHTLTGDGGGVAAVAVTPDARAVSGSRDGTVRVWDPATGMVLALTGHGGGVAAVAVTPDARAVSGSSDTTVRVWDLAKGKPLHVLTGHQQSVSAVAVTRDGGRAVSGSGDGSLRVWELATGRTLHVLTRHAGPVTAVAVTPDGGRAVSASGDGSLRVWDLTTDRALHAPPGHGDRVTGVAVTPDGGRAVSASWDGSLRVWDLAAGQALRTLAGHDGRVTGVAVTPDGRRAVSASDDGTLRVWDLATGQALPRSSQRVTGSDEPGQTRYEEPVSAVAVTPDGRRAVSASWDGSLRVWDLAAGQALGTLTGHAGPVNAVAVTPDGGRAVSASDDNTVRVWDLKTIQLQVIAPLDRRATCIGLAPDGITTVVGDDAGTIYCLTFANR